MFLIRVKLNMDPTQTAAIVALRPAIENLIMEATENPEAFFPLSPQNERLISLVVNLSRLHSPKFGEELDGNVKPTGCADFRTSVPFDLALHSQMEDQSNFDG